MGSGVTGISSVYGGCTEKFSSNLYAGQSTGILPFPLARATPSIAGNDETGTAIYVFTETLGISSGPHISCTCISLSPHTPREDARTVSTRTAMATNPLVPLPARGGLFPAPYAGKVALVADLGHVVLGGGPAAARASRLLRCSACAAGSGRGMAVSSERV